MVGGGLMKISYDTSTRTGGPFLNNSLSRVLPQCDACQATWNMGNQEMTGVVLIDV